MLIAFSPSPSEKEASVPILSPNVALLSRAQAALMHLSRQTPAFPGACCKDTAPQAILTTVRGSVPPVRLPSVARACLQTKHFEEVLNREQVNQKGKIKKGKALGRQAGGGVVGSPSKLWNNHLQHSLWMLRGTKSLSELLRENLSMTCIKG